MRHGTNHFRFKSDIVRYYAKQGISEHDALRKLQEKEIALGPPMPNTGTLTLDSDGRYWVGESS